MEKIRKNIKKIILILIVFVVFGFSLYLIMSFEKESEYVDSLYAAEKNYVGLWDESLTFVPYYDFKDDGTGVYGFWIFDSDRPGREEGTFEYELSPVSGESNVFSVNFTNVDGMEDDWSSVEGTLDVDEGKLELDYQETIELYVRNEDDEETD